MPLCRAYSVGVSAVQAASAASSSSWGSGPRSSPPASRPASVITTCGPISICWAIVPTRALAVRTARNLAATGSCAYACLSSLVDTVTARAEGRHHQHAAHDRHVLQELDFVHCG